MTGNRNLRQVSKTRPAVAQAPVKKKKKRRFIILKLLVFILLCLVVALSFARMGYEFVLDGAAQAESIPHDSGGTEFRIEFGSTTTQIVEQLKAEGYDVNTDRYKILSKLMGFDGLYRAGRYILTEDMNDYALMLRLTAEPLKNPSVDVRIPEGMTVIELANWLDAQDLIVKERFLALARMHLTQFPFQKELEVVESRVYPLEGYLYPDTYKMDEGWTEEKLVLRMLDEFNRVYTDDDRARAEELGMTTDEVITLASLIEMEALYPTDLKKISAVFHNRLNNWNIPMLQTDAAVQYARVMAGLGRTTFMLYVDLEIDSPYNTYKHAGLPPGPICSPRRDAIQAALYPDETKDYYFFATPDGTNIYNETYDGHLNDQARYGVSGQ